MIKIIIETVKSKVVIEIDEDKVNVTQDKKVDLPEEKNIDSKATINKKGNLIRKKARQVYKMKDKRECPRCHNEFIPNGPRQKYCSVPCGMKPKWPKKKKTFQDIKKEFDEIKPSAEASGLVDKPIRIIPVDKTNKQSAFGKVKSFFKTKPIQSNRSNTPEEPIDFDKIHDVEVKGTLTPEQIARSQGKPYSEINIE